jgi:hypothetical protein
MYMRLAVPNFRIPTTALSSKKAGRYFMAMSRRLFRTDRKLSKAFAVLVNAPDEKSIGGPFRLEEASTAIK